MTAERALVITSISPPSDILAAYARECVARGIQFLLVGDVRSPSDFHLDGCEFWGLARQRSLPFRTAAMVRERHYARKNIGYLLAMQRGATSIMETDDDNIPRDAFWQPACRTVRAATVKDAGWANMYAYFTDDTIWPRGFPLEHVRTKSPAPAPPSDLDCPIQQGLADDNPDVDAVYRLTRPLPFMFRNNPPVAVGAGTWCPFNSQNTVWFRDAFPLLYLPSFCSFRMTDIWRSFVAQRICWTNGWHVLFTAPTVRQERNEHNLLRDFEDEVPGYLNNARICAELAALDLPPGAVHVPANLRACYGRMVSIGVIDARELELVDAWLADLASLGAA